MPVENRLPSAGGTDISGITDFADLTGRAWPPLPLHPLAGVGEDPGLLARGCDREVHPCLLSGLCLRPPLARAYPFPLPGELEHWSTVLLARTTKPALVADRLRPLAQRVGGRISTKIPVPPRGFLGRVGGQRSWRLMAQGGALLGIVAGTVAFTSFDKAVTLTVDGQTSSVHAFGSSVGDILDHKGIHVGSHDLVSPAVSAPVHDGQHLVVRYGRELTITVDGERRVYWTTALTVDQALAQLGLRDADAALSVSRGATLGRGGLSMSLTTPKDVVVTVDGRKIEQTTTAATVGVLLQQLGITLGAQDSVSVPLDAALAAGQTLAVTRIVTKNLTLNEKIKMPVHSAKDASMAKGTVKVTTKGHAGSQRVTYQYVYQNGKLVSRTKLTVVVIRAAITQVQKVGTKADGAPARPATRARSAAARPASTGRRSPSASPAATRGRSTRAATTASTSSRCPPGTASAAAGNPIDASSAEQTHRAMILYNKAGAGQWTCGSHLFDYARPIG